MSTPEVATASLFSIGCVHVYCVARELGGFGEHKNTAELNDVSPKFLQFRLELYVHTTVIFVGHFPELAR